MRQDPYKKLVFKNWLIPRLIGAGIILITVLIIVILTTMQQSDQLYLEGVVKSMPLVSNDKMKMLGDLYIDLNRDFEKDIKDMELNFANRTNKRGDKIHYGVNGKENADELYNEDYVNGIHIIYAKGNANRPDGDSNFNDMISFLTTTLYSSMDEYTDEELKEIFTKLFKLTHTFQGTSTELYPCKHGCAWCKYYCGDSIVKGEVGGNTVGFYKVDKYMGKNNEYGLMYDPFLIKPHNLYTELEELSGDSIYNRTPYSYNDIKEVLKGSGDNERYVPEIFEEHDSVEAENSEIFNLEEPLGYCIICEKEKPRNETTRTYGGCISHVKCHHGEVKLLKSDPEDEGTYIYWYMGRDKEDCDNYTAKYECTFSVDDDTTSEDIEYHEEIESKYPDIGCKGYYTCESGHDHYACPGHIIVCCFGHTNLNLDIKIMYYEEMIEVLKDVIS